MKFHWIRFAILSSVVGVATPAMASSLGAYVRNQDGVHKFESKAYYPAYQQFLKAMEHDPLNPEVQLNLARVFEANEEFAKAEQAYKGALNLLPPDSTRRFETLFNLAGVQARQNRLPEALATYQVALELDPNSVEVKTNIELLWKQSKGGGQGGGKPQDQQQQQNQDQQQDQKNQDQNPQQEEQKKQPKPFRSQELTPEDVKRILDEIKNQEQNIRAQDYEKGAKDAGKSKDW